MSRNSHWRFSIKKAVLKNFAMFIGKNLSWSVFLVKLFQHGCFPVNIAKFLRTPVLKNIWEWLLLKVVFKSNEEQHLLVFTRWNGLRYNYVLCLFVSFCYYYICIHETYKKTPVLEFSFKRCQQLYSIETLLNRVVPREFLRNF